VAPDRVRALLGEGTDAEALGAGLHRAVARGDLPLAAVLAGVKGAVVEAAAPGGGGSGEAPLSVGELVSSAVMGCSAYNAALSGLSTAQQRVHAIRAAGLEPSPEGLWCVQYLITLVQGLHAFQDRAMAASSTGGASVGTPSAFLEEASACLRASALGAPAGAGGGGGEALAGVEGCLVALAASCLHASVGDRRGFQLLLAGLCARHCEEGGRGEGQYLPRIACCLATWPGSVLEGTAREPGGRGGANATAAAATGGGGSGGGVLSETVLAVLANIAMAAFASKPSSLDLVDDGVRCSACCILQLLSQRFLGRLVPLALPLKPLQPYRALPPVPQLVADCEHMQKAGQRGPAAALQLAATFQGATWVSNLPESVQRLCSGEGGDSGARFTPL